ncbi:hypothetical protein FJZ31_43085 [Candidatus Poribacteria bacterium]|nr:hypothetical protein [Candidatus Poribacteria bacterium]
MKLSICLLLITVMLMPLRLWAAVWTDEFEEDKLNKAWDTITDRPEKKGFVKLEKGKLLVNEPVGNFGHLIKDGRPLVLRDAPKGEFSISALLDSVPEAPAKSYWIGIFVIGSAKNDAAMSKNWSVLTFGGSNGEVKALIGSMIDDVWNDKGHFDIPKWPIYLKLEKKETALNGYYKKNESDDWLQVGAAWNDNMNSPEKVGLGFINNWGGANLTMIAEFFTLEGPNVQPFAVESTGKLSVTWGQLKSLEQ